MEKSVWACRTSCSWRLFLQYLNVRPQKANGLCPVTKWSMAPKFYNDYYPTKRLHKMIQEGNPNGCLLPISYPLSETSPEILYLLFLLLQEKKGWFPKTISFFSTQTANVFYFFHYWTSAVTETYIWLEGGSENGLPMHRFLHEWTSIWTLEALWRPFNNVPTTETRLSSIIFVHCYTAKTALFPSMYCLTVKKLGTCLPIKEMQL